MFLRSATALALVAWTLAAGAQTVGPQAAASEANAGVRCRQVQPVLPEVLRRDRSFTTASVVVEVVVDPPGNVTGVTVVDSSGSIAWENAVADAMYKVKCDLGAPVTARFAARQTFTVKLGD